MRFDSWKSITSLLEALGSQGYQVPFIDYEKQFKNKGFDKHVHCYNFELTFEHYNSIYSNDMYFVLRTEDNGNKFTIMGTMTRRTIEERLRILLLAYVKYEIPFDIGTQANELLKVLGDDKGGITYGD